MKKEVWKFQLDVEVSNEFYMPKDAEIICVQTQREMPCMWVLLNPEDQNVKRVFDVYGTGREISYTMGQDWNYTGTFQLFNGNYVGHIFEYIGI